MKRIVGEHQRIKISSKKRAKTGIVAHTTTVAFMITFNLVKESSSSNIKIKSLKTLSGFRPSCTATTTYIIAARFKVLEEDGKKLEPSICLQEYPSTQRKFIPKDGGQPNGEKVFSLYTPGTTNCMLLKQLNADKVISTFVAFILEPLAQPIGGNCRISGVITNKDLEVHKVGPVYDVFDKLIADGDYKSLTRINLYGPHITKLPESTLIVELEDTPSSAINDELIEMVLLAPAVEQAIASTEDSMHIYSRTDFDTINLDIDKNTFATKIRLEDHCKRLVVDDLPGYFLGGWNLASLSGSEVAFQRVAKIARSTRAHSLIVLCYASRPDEIRNAQWWRLTIESQGYMTQTSPDSTLHKFHYAIEVKDNGSFFVFRILRDGMVNLATVQFPNQNLNSYLFFSFTVGYGALFLTGDTTIRSKTHLNLVVYQDGQEKVEWSGEIEGDAELSSVIPIELKDSEYRWAKATLTSNPPNRLNTPGFRISELNGIYGAYLSHKVVDVDEWRKVYPTCLVFGYQVNHCLAFARLVGPQHKSTDLVYVRNQQEIGALHPESSILKHCAVPINVRACAIAKPGSINVLNSGIKSILFVLSIGLDEYNALDQRCKDFFYEYENNVKTKYLLPCDLSCK